jgi:hypothetical protein
VQPSLTSFPAPEMRGLQDTPGGPEARSAPCIRPQHGRFSKRSGNTADARDRAQGPLQRSAQRRLPRLRLSYARVALPRRGSGRPGRNTGKPSLYAGTCGILRALAQSGSSVTTTSPRSPGSALQETHSVAPACLRTNQPNIIMTVVIASGVCRDVNRDGANLIGFDVAP